MDAQTSQTNFKYAGGQYPGSFSIKKNKLWHSFEVKNELTGRLNKKFVCSFCQRHFNRLSNVKHHLRSHLDVRQYTCNLCNSTFVQKGNRDRHVSKQSCQGFRNRVARTQSSNIAESA